MLIPSKFSDTLYRFQVIRDSLFFFFFYFTSGRSASLFQIDEGSTFGVRYKQRTAVILSLIESDTGKSQPLKIINLLHNNARVCSMILFTVAFLFFKKCESDRAKRVVFFLFISLY